MNGNMVRGTLQKLGFNTIETRLFSRSRNEKRGQVPSSRLLRVDNVREDGRSTRARLQIQIPAPNRDEQSPTIELTRSAGRADRDRAPWAWPEWLSGVVLYCTYHIRFIRYVIGHKTLF